MFNNLKNKKVLITGNSGFKGAWLSLFLRKVGANVIGLSDKIHWENSIFTKKNIKNFVKQYWCDIRNIKKIEEVFLKEKPNVIFHLAAQPIVIEGYKKPLETLNININGTINICEITKKLFPKIPLIIITSDKVYKNQNKSIAFTEEHSIFGDCPYSTSKACSEMIAQSYFSISKDMNIRTLRAGNVIGGGDWSINRLIPDIIKSITENKVPVIRNPKHIRPWSHVLDIIYGYLIVADRALEEESSFKSYNFSADFNKNYNVLKVANLFLEKFNVKTIRFNNNKKYNEKTSLIINSKKVRKDLCWEPLYSTEKAINLTADWYLDNWNKKASPLDLTINQIENYINEVNKNYNNLFRNIV